MELLGLGFKMGGVRFLGVNELVLPGNGEANRVWRTLVCLIVVDIKIECALAPQQRKGKTQKDETTVTNFSGRSLYFSESSSEWLRGYDIFLVLANLPILESARHMRCRFLSNASEG